MFGELRKRSAEDLIQIGFDGYGFGGRHIDGEGNFLEDIVGYTASLIPQESVRFALGIGTVTYLGLQSAFDAVVVAITTNYGAMAGASAQLADLAGVGAALGILLGAISARIGISILSTFTRIL